jgi:putative redox protein
MSYRKTADLVFRGGMRFDAELGSGAKLAFDTSSAGGPGPVEVVIAALAACSAMDVISIALKKRQDVVRYEIHVSADQREAYPQIYTRIDVVHEVEGPGVEVEAIRRCIELSAEKYCPVSAMLSAGDTEIHHRYRVIADGAEPVEGEVVVTGPFRRPDVLTG